MKKQLLAGLTMGLILAGSVGIASATPIALNVDFGSTDQLRIYDGIGAAPSSGTTWNGIMFSSGTNLLKYSDGSSATGISIASTASQAYSDGGNALLGDRVFVTGSWGPFDVTISGLNSGSTYDLYVYGSNTIYASTYTVGAISDYALGGQNLPFVYHNNYGLLEGLNATNGQIHIDVARYSGSAAAVIGGFQLIEYPVPEPATMLLLGMGIAGLAGFRLRRKK
ncbi:MAG: hypothetical protein A2511_00460 [Deltaproteobacteria bacterium RIFOXYD12_FULL_50_9]|nr:MAG: hypothetical protein A2511_00460 [Deltaproteobacteria bacterium RIFOXYD12_FULL_50_9]